MLCRQIQCANGVLRICAFVQKQKVQCLVLQLRRVSCQNIPGADADAVNRELRVSATKLGRAMMIPKTQRGHLYFHRDQGVLLECVCQSVERVTGIQWQ